MNEKLISAYREFLDKLDTISTQGRVADYHWYKLPEKISPIWMAYCFMLDEHAREIPNAINELLRYIDYLEAWNVVINDKDEGLKLKIIVQFIQPIGTIAINLPYVIRSRFIYSIAHLSHQVNRVKKTKWVDDLPIDREIYFAQADSYGSTWKGYNKLKVALEKIANSEFRQETYDFRDKYNHRFSPSIELGVTGIVKRNVGDNRISYTIGYTEPLKINQLLITLKKQHSYCLKAHEKYMNLIHEHIQAILGAP